jgi:hypothetical protein
MRRSVSCICAGLLFSVPIWAIAYAVEYDWQPHKWLAVPLITCGIAGTIWLYDEIFLH